LADELESLGSTDNYKSLRLKINGHVSQVVTLSVYAQLMNQVNQKTACKLENAIFQVSGSRMVAETKKRGYSVNHNLLKL